MKGICPFGQVSFLYLIWEDVEVQSYPRRGIRLWWTCVYNRGLRIYKRRTGYNETPFVFTWRRATPNQGSDKEIESWQEANAIISENIKVTDI